MSETKSLPEYVAVRSQDWPAWLLVTCPREDCGETFLVKATPWRKSRKYTASNGKEFVVTGRACPYCFRAAHMPKRISKSSG